MQITYILAIVLRYTAPRKTLLIIHMCVRIFTAAFFLTTQNKTNIEINSNFYWEKNGQKICAHKIEHYTLYKRTK